jgi:hypothetical protein
MSFLLLRGAGSCGGLHKVNGAPLGLTLININPGPNLGIIDKYQITTKAYKYHGACGKIAGR